jgi:sugar phosphate permease
MLMAVAGSFGFAGSLKLAVNWISKRYLAQGIALVSSMGLLGGLVVQIPLSYSIAMVGWRHSLYGVALIGITIFVLIYFIVENHPKTTETASIKIITSKMSFADKFKLAFINKQNLFCSIYSGLMNLPIFMLGAMWGVVYLMNVNHVSELAASTTCTMIFLGTLLGCPFLGFIADKFSCHIRLMKIGALFALALILIIMFYPTQSLMVLIISYFALGAITSTQTLSYPTVIESNPKNISSSATSVISMMTMVGGAVSQPLFGFILHLSSHDTLIEASHGYQRAMGILPCAFMIAFISSLYIKDANNQK